MLQITGDQNSPDEGQIFRTVRLSFLAERSLFTHRAAPAPEVVFRCKTDRNYIKIKAMTEEKTEQAVEQAAAPETKKEEAPAAPAPTPEDIALLREIRDLMKNQPKA